MRNSNPTQVHLYHIENLKSLTRYRLDKVSQRAKLKSFVARLVNILFPELEKLVPSLHMKSFYVLLSEFPLAVYVADAHFARLANLICNASKGHYRRDKAIQIREAARHSVGSVILAKTLGIEYTIKLIGELTEEMDEIQTEIKKIVDKSRTILTTIPRLGYKTVAVILAEVDDFSNVKNPYKLLCSNGEARFKISSLCSL